MTKNDLDTLVGEESTSEYGLARFGSLLDKGTYYWLATAGNSTSLWRVDGGGSNVYGDNANTYSYNTSYGVRPVVSLVSGIQAIENLQGRHRADPYNSQK